jgi:ABC-type multidrug transport system permease subunit
LQTGILTLSTLEATVVAVAGIGSAVPALLTAAATVFVGASAHTGRLGRSVRWTERVIVATFTIDTAIALFTAGAALEPMVWLSRLLIPLFVLRFARAERKNRNADVETIERVEVAA